MGREVRKVPPNWDHPRDQAGHLVPMYDQTFADAVAEWKLGYEAWERGERPSYFRADGCPQDYQYWEYDGGPPMDRNGYRSWCDAEATWFQVFETVSEGTPVTPPFATTKELIDHLVVAGESLMPRQYWDGPWKRENAEAFVNAGYAPSMIIADGKIYSPRDGIPP